MFSTAEDMTELDRSLFLLRKGYFIQKTSVSATHQSSVLKPNAHLGGQQLAPTLSRKRCKRKTTASSDQLDVHVGRQHAN